MKKTLAAIAASAIIALPSWAANKGDPMPKSSGTMIGYEMYQENATDGILMAWYSDGDAEAYRVCNGVINDKPYAFYDEQTKTLYLDNLVTDGLIDKIVENPTSTPAEDMPVCSTPVQR